jgi:hypothetical protein
MLSVTKSAKTMSAPKKENSHAGAAIDLVALGLLVDEVSVSSAILKY